MSLRDSAIVAYAETKVVEKSERDVWELGAEALESLLENGTHLLMFQPDRSAQ